METKQLDINNLSSAEKALLMKQFSAEQKAEKSRKAADREALKGLQDELCGKWAQQLVAFGNEQANIVDAVFADTAPLIAIKAALYDVPSDKQDSHTFTSRDGMSSILVGFNTIIGFDGTGSAGIEKVKEYLSSLSEQDSKRAIISKILTVLMKPDKNGSLNPARVTELANLRAEINNELFSDGIDIIIKAQHKTRTSSYVRGWHRFVDDKGKETKVQFSVTAQ